MKISILVQTYNSAQTLERTLKSVQGFDEIVICDMYSTDDTVAIAQRYDCRVVYHEHTGIVEPARDFAISQTNGDWVLVVDSDEVVTLELRDYLYELIKHEKDFAGLYIPRMNHFMGRFMHCTYPDSILRFMRRDSVRWPVTIHSVPVINGKVLRVSPKRKDLAFRHYDNASIQAFLNKQNIYTEKEVLRKLGRKKYSSFVMMILSAGVGFFKTYFLHKGFLDGREGLAYAVYESYYKFIILTKIWEKKSTEK